MVGLIKMQAAGYIVAPFNKKSVETRRIHLAYIEILNISFWKSHAV